VELDWRKALDIVKEHLAKRAEREAELIRRYVSEGVDPSTYTYLLGCLAAFDEAIQVVEEVKCKLALNPDGDFLCQACWR